jgi:hypothetical protein
MPGDLVRRVFIRLTGRIVPLGERTAWLVHWNSSLHSLTVLIERGEFPRNASPELGRLCGAALADAFRTRSVRFDFEERVRGPILLLAGLYSVLLTLAACTHGFATTRSLIGAGRDRVLPYAIVIAFALIVGITMTVRCRSPLRGHDWRYWSLLLLKTGAFVAILSLVWIEGGITLRRHLTNDTVRALGGGLVLTIIYLAAVGSAVLWCLGDQQRRCPVCLRRMASPVRIGSWASVFEPVITQLLCDEGHGALCVQECEMGEPDLWLIFRQTDYRAARSFPDPRM